MQNDKLLNALKVIQEECSKQIMCTDCQLYDDGCIVEPVPTDWKINIEETKGGVDNAE